MAAPALSRLILKCRACQCTFSGLWRTEGLRKAWRCPVGGFGGRGASVALGGALVGALVAEETGARLLGALFAA